MKKLIALALVLVLILSMVACGGSPASSVAPSGAAPSSEASSAPSSEAPPSSSEAPAPVKKYERPAEYTTRGWGDTWYPETDTITMVYHPHSNELAKALGINLMWPTELTDEWKGWDYTDIQITPEGYSVRTIKAEAYLGKYQDQRKQHIALLGDEINIVQDTKNGVLFSELEAKEGTSPRVMANAAYEALYMQTWLLISEEWLGVTVTCGDKTYTTTDLLAMEL